MFEFKIRRLAMIILKGRKSMFFMQPGSILNREIFSGLSEMVFELFSLILKVIIHQSTQSLSER